jgi:hypothetical protein
MGFFGTGGTSLKIPSSFSVDGIRGMGAVGISESLIWWEADIPIPSHLKH